MLNISEIRSEHHGKTTGFCAECGPYTNHPCIVNKLCDELERAWSCQTCGAPGTWQRKFNGGNPIDLLCHDCECSEKSGDLQAEKLVLRVERDVALRERDAAREKVGYLTEAAEQADRDRNSLHAAAQEQVARLTEERDAAKDVTNRCRVAHGYDGTSPLAESWRYCEAAEDAVGRLLEDRDAWKVAATDERDFLVQDAVQAREQREAAESKVLLLQHALRETADELAKHGWGDMHYGSQGQDERVAKTVKRAREVLVSLTEPPDDALMAEGYREQADEALWLSEQSLSTEPRESGEPSLPVEYERLHDVIHDALVSWGAEDASDDVQDAIERARFVPVSQMPRFPERAGYGCGDCDSINHTAGSTLCPVISQTDIPPAPIDRSKLAVAFMRQTPTTRVQQARKLGVGDGLDDLTSTNASFEILRRVRDAGKVEQLAELVASSQEFK